MNGPHSAMCRVRDDGFPLAAALDATRNNQEYRTEHWVTNLALPTNHVEISSSDSHQFAELREPRAKLRRSACDDAADQDPGTEQAHRRACCNIGSSCNLRSSEVPFTFTLKSKQRVQGSWPRSVHEHV